MPDAQTDIAMIKIMPIEEFLGVLRAQQVPSNHYAFKCPICGTVQSADSLTRAGVNRDDVKKFIGFSCIGRFTNAGSWKQGDQPGRGCNWSLGGLLRLHNLEVVDQQGKMHMHFEPATREEARALMMQAAMIMWAIYDHPLDLPNDFVVRRWSVVGGEVIPEQSCFTEKTLDEARARIPPGLFNLGRMPDDDPKIVEVWL
jgi:hypothetical protein